MESVESDELQGVNENGNDASASTVAGMPNFWDPAEWEPCEDEPTPFLIWPFFMAMGVIAAAGAFFWLLEEQKRQAAAKRRTSSGDPIEIEEGPVHRIVRHSKAFYDLAQPLISSLVSGAVQAANKPHVAPTTANASSERDSNSQLNTNSYEQSIRKDESNTYISRTDKVQVDSSSLQYSQGASQLQQTTTQFDQQTTGADQIVAPPRTKKITVSQTASNEKAQNHTTNLSHDAGTLQQLEHLAETVAEKVVGSSVKEIDQFAQSDQQHKQHKVVSTTHQQIINVSSSKESSQSSFKHAQPTIESTMEHDELTAEGLNEQQKQATDRLRNGTQTNDKSNKSRASSSEQVVEKHIAHDELVPESINEHQKAAVSRLQSGVIAHDEIASDLLNDQQKKTVDRQKSKNATTISGTTVIESTSSTIVKTEQISVSGQIKQTTETHTTNMGSQAAADGVKTTITTSQQNQSSAQSHPEHVVVHEEIVEEQLNEQQKAAAKRSQSKTAQQKVNEDDALRSAEQVAQQIVSDMHQQAVNSVAANEQTITMQSTKTIASGSQSIKQETVTHQQSASSTQHQQQTTHVQESTTQVLQMPVEYSVTANLVWEPQHAVIEATILCEDEFFVESTSYQATKPTPRIGQLGESEDKTRGSKTTQRKSTTARTSNDAAQRLLHVEGAHDERSEEPSATDAQEIETMEMDHASDYEVEDVPHDMIPIQKPKSHQNHQNAHQQPEVLPLELQAVEKIIKQSEHVLAATKEDHKLIEKQQTYARLIADAPVITEKPKIPRGAKSVRQKLKKQKSDSLLEAAGVGTTQELLHKLTSLEQVSQVIGRAGLVSSNLIFGIDYTSSNKYQGVNTFNDRSLHHVSSDCVNPYQQVIGILGKTLQPFATSGVIPAYGFGDVFTADWSVFPLKPDCHPVNFDQVLSSYNTVTPDVMLAGPTNFAPLIYQAVEICQRVGDYHILVIVADGQVTNERATRRAIVDACDYPLSIIVVGVGDGPWDMMEVFDEKLPKRPWDNFHFVDFHKVVLSAGPHNADLSFAVNALAEVPEQYKMCKALGLVKSPAI